MQRELTGQSLTAALSIPPKSINRSRSNPPRPDASRHNAPDNSSFTVDLPRRGSPVHKRLALLTSLATNEDEALQNNSFVHEPTKPCPIKYKIPTRMNVPAKRKLYPASTEKRVTRAKTTHPVDAQKPSDASHLARAHFRTSGSGLQDSPINVDAPAFNEQAVSSMPLDPSLRVIQPKPVHVPTSTILGQYEPSNFHGTTPAHGSHQPPEPISPAQAHPTKNPLPWYSDEIADRLVGLPLRQRLHLATYPFTSPRCALTREPPHNFTAIVPLPKGLENSPGRPLPKILDVSTVPLPDTLDHENFIRSIVTFRRLGFRFDEIAQIFHRAGLPAEIVTEAAVEGIWREAPGKEFARWYGERVAKLMVFEKDDPLFRVREG
ncbi:MAG: hypothetical protein Q9182_006429 [Xanthomendoza sp. 2 TL-2023]